MSDILKDAIAQAKVLREVAVENAKTILMESFEPKINGILSQKLTREMDGADEEENFEDDGLEETEDPGEGEEFPGLSSDDQDVTPDLEETEDPGKGDTFNKFSKKDQDVTPILNEDDDEFGADEEEDLNAPELSTENEDNDEDDLEFESILKELDDEMEDELPNEDSDEDEFPEGLPQTEGEDEEIVGGEEFPEAGETEDDELNLENDDEDEDDELGGLGGALGESDDNDEDDEEINIDELLGEDEENGEEITHNADKDPKWLDPSKPPTAQFESLKKQNRKLKKQLSQSNAAVKVLNEQISDINILNHKLVHTVKLFRNFNLSNESKMRVVETFDRAKSVREIKLIYTTLYESLKNTGMKRTKKPITSITEVKNAGASKTVIGSKHFAQSTIISEGSDLKARFAKLANIK